MKEVLILCTANSCRSQMAEGLINHELKGKWRAYSAGLEPSFVHPWAIKVMKEIGIEISGRKMPCISRWHPEGPHRVSGPFQDCRH